MLERWRRWRTYRRLYLSRVRNHNYAGWGVPDEAKAQYRRWARHEAGYSRKPRFWRG